MPVSVRIDIKGNKEYQRMLTRINPKKNPSWLTRALKRAAFLVQELATTEKIKRSGPAGVVDPVQVTSRTGTLRRSIAIDDAGTPHFITIGSNLIYAGVHELGSRDGHTRARPYLKPALEDVSRQMDSIFRREWEREVGR